MTVDEICDVTDAADLHAARVAALTSNSIHPGEPTPQAPANASRPSRYVDPFNYQNGRTPMSAPTLHQAALQAGPSVRGVRLRLKRADQSAGFVQGAWWPRSTQLTTELPPLLAALRVRLGRIDRVIYDENGWTPAPLHIRYRGSEVHLDASFDRSSNTLSVIDEHGVRLVLLVVPPYTEAARAYATVMTAARTDNVSTAEELLGIGANEAEYRRAALLAQQRWESEGGALRLAEFADDGTHADAR